MYHKVRINNSIHQNFRNISVSQVFYVSFRDIFQNSVPGFLREGRQPIIFAIFSRKPHEIALKGGVSSPLP